MPSIVTSLSHPPPCDTRQGKGHHPPQQPSDEEICFCASHTMGPVPAPFSVWFIIERCGEVNKSWLHRNNHPLEQICVIKQHVGISSTRCHCSDNNDVPFLEMNILAVVVCVKRMRFAGEMIFFNLKLQMQRRQNYHNSHQRMNDITGVVWGQVSYR